MESFVAICRRPLEHYTEKKRPESMVLMFHRHGPSRIFGSRVLCMDDYFDALELEKSIVKAADYEVLPGRQQDRVVDGMAKGHGKHVLCSSRSLQVVSLVGSCPMAEILSAVQITQL